jgi:hypothetical protein
MDTIGNSRQLNLVTPILQSIARSAVAHADIIMAPRLAKLPTLDVKIPVKGGQWAVTQMPAIGTKQRDTLVRLKQDVALEISLAELAPTVTSTCTNLFTDSTDQKPQHANLKRAPTYLGRRWHPAAWEQSVPGQTQFFGCLEVAPKLVVIVQISYGAPEMSNADAVSVRLLLDNIAEAIEHGPHTSGQIKTTITDEFFEGFRL